MSPSPLQALPMDNLQRSAVSFCRFAKSERIPIVNKAGPRRWEGRGFAGFYEVGIVEDEENWQQW